MIHRVLQIEDWVVDFLFARKNYDVEGVLSCLYDIDAPLDVMRRAYRIMNSGKYNRGFTYANPNLHRAVVITGPTTSGKQFQNSFSHEIDHLSDFISSSLDLETDEEATAYLVGYTTMYLSDILCELGCATCHPEEPSGLEV